MSMRRISIHAEVDGHLRAHDVALCARSPVAELLPDLVDIVGHARDGVRRELRTSAGTTLDESMSLTDNGIHDGDVVTLDAVHAPARGLLGVEPVRTMACTGDVVRIDTGRLIEISWCWLMLAVAGALVWTGLQAAALGAAIAIACCALATSWRAVATGSPALGVAGAVGAGAAGFVVVPTGPGAAHVLLGAAVVFAVSVVMSRLVPVATTALTASGSAAAVVAAVAALTVAATWNGATAGAVLTVCGIGLLVLAPRCAASLAGVPAAAHSVLTGLVIGSMASAVIGVAVVASATRTGPSIAFTSVTALLLLVRARTHVDAGRRIALTVAGLACATAALSVVVVVFPGATPWVGTGVVAAVVVAATVRPGPGVVRAVDGLDYLCAALLAPLACWVIGVYSVARDWVFT